MSSFANDFSGSRWRVAVLEPSDAGSLGFFDLEPSLAADRAIGARPVLRDDTLETELAGMRKELGAVAVEVLDVIRRPLLLGQVLVRAGALACHAVGPAGELRV